MLNNRRLRISILIAFLFIFAFSGVAGKVSFHYIRKLIRKRNYSKAADMLEKSLDGVEGRTYYRALLLLAGIETSLQKAEQYYRSIIKNGTAQEAVTARVELAKVYYSMGDYSKVVELVGNLSSRKVSSSYLEGLFFKALSLRQLGRFEEARRSFASIDRGRYLYPSYMAQAELDMQDGNIDDAIKRFKMIAAEHSNPVAGFKLGECYEIKGDREKALIVYRTLLNKFPESLEASRAKEKISALMRLPERKVARDTREAPAGGRVEGEKLFTIQFGAFSDRENAVRMVSELKKLNIDAWIESFELNGTTIYRVRYGKFENREKAERDAREFQDRLGLNCRVLPLR